MAARRSTRSTEDLVVVYLHEVSQHPLLTREDEVRLARAIEAGRAAEDVLTRWGKEVWPLGQAERSDLLRRAREGANASHDFVQGNLRLVVSIARRYQRSGLPLLDLVQEGNLGLLRAVERFDWRKGFKFSTYATWWIRQGISRGIIDSGRTIRLPVSASVSLAHVEQARAELGARLGRAATRSEILAVVGISRARFDELVLHQTVPRSLSEPTGTDQDGELGDRIADDGAPSPFDHASDALLVDEIVKLLSILDDRERMIVRLRFGLDGGDALTLDEIGRIVGLTRERIRQIECRALGKLRASPTQASAREFLT